MAEIFGYVFGDIARLMRRRFDEMSRDLGVTSTQSRVILSVSRHPGINQGALAELLEVEPITTCRMVDRLEQAGLVERRADPNDRRAWQIFLTEAALPLLDRLQDRVAHLNMLSFTGLSETDQERVAAALEVIRHNLAGLEVREAHG